MFSFIEPLTDVFIFLHLSLQRAKWTATDSRSTCDSHENIEMLCEFFSLNYGNFLYLYVETAAAEVVSLPFSIIVNFS